MPPSASAEDGAKDVSKSPTFGSRIRTSPLASRRNSFSLARTEQARARLALHKAEAKSQHDLLLAHAAERGLTHAREALEVRRRPRGPEPEPDARAGARHGRLLHEP